jgi:hypothetical protein
VDIDREGLSGLCVSVFHGRSWGGLVWGLESMGSLGLGWRLGLSMPFWMARTIVIWQGFLQVGGGFL